MNSVMEIGEKIVFIHDGKKCWEGNSQGVMDSEDAELNDFIFASDFAKRTKKSIDQTSS